MPRTTRWYSPAHTLIAAHSDHQKPAQLKCWPFSELHREGAGAIAWRQATLLQAWPQPTPKSYHPFSCKARLPESGVPSGRPELKSSANWTAGLIARAQIHFKKQKFQNLLFEMDLGSRLN
jgi:hypothetical protein